MDAVPRKFARTTEKCDDKKERNLSVMLHSYIPLVSRQAAQHPDHRQFLLKIFADQNPLDCRFPRFPANGGVRRSVSMCDH